MKRSMLLLSLAAVLFVLPGLAPAGQPTYTLKYSHVHTETEPYHGAFLEWAENVKKRTNGDLVMEIYHSSQLGMEEDIIEQMRMGAAIACLTDAARLGNYIREFSLLNLPYFVENQDEVKQLNELKIVKEWEKRLEDELGIHIFSFAYIQGFRHMLTNGPIRKPADLNGLRIRTAPAPAWQEMVRALGAVPVAIPYVEVYSAVQTKAVDGCENVYVSSYHTGMYEVLKYLSETHHLLLINIPIVSAEWFRALPPEYQKILDEECQKAGERVSYDILNKYSEEAKQGMIAKGVTIVEPKDIDMAAFREAGKKAYEVLGVTAAREAVYKEMGKK